MPAFATPFQAVVSSGNAGQALGTAAQGTARAAALVDHVHPVRFSLGVGAANAPASNGDVTVVFTANTVLTFQAKGSDGSVRSATLTLA